MKKMIVLLIIFLNSFVYSVWAEDKYYQVDPLSEVPGGSEGASIRLGYQILTETYKYIGRNGLLSKNTQNKMSCTNCHLNGGILPFGNSWVNTFATYPQYRLREEKIQTLPERLNSCLKNNLNGKNLKEDSLEVTSMLMYYKWIGRGTKITNQDSDERLGPLKFLDRKASPELGKEIFANKCSRCHGVNGQGALAEDKLKFKYPPLWGDETYVIGSSMSRLSILARFVYMNMPIDKKGLSIEEAWDVSAYIQSQKHPTWRSKTPPFKNNDFKPFDYPIPPYKDPFTFEQHKFGPYQPIIDFYKKNSKANNAETSLHI
jgi:thiosulfate dehydrogenase